MPSNFFSLFCIKCTPFKGFEFYIFNQVASFKKIKLC